jgi:hypothetical protein
VARAKLIFDVERADPDDSISSDAGLAERFGALDQKLGNEFDLLPDIRFDERPFIMDVALERYVGDAGMLKQIGRCTERPGAVEIFW